MARYNHLTVFQKSVDLTVRIYKEVHHFSREYKYSMGTELQKACLELLTNVIAANTSPDKTAALTAAQLQIDRLRIFVRILYELEAISGKKHEVLVRFIDEVGRMIGAWRKSPTSPNL